MPVEFGSAFHQAVLDSLLHQIAILDRHGTIMATNRAWDQFYLDYDGNLARCEQGVNYFEAVNELSNEGIRAVIEGKKETYELEYACMFPKRKRWFRMVVTPLRLEPATGRIDGAVISRINITERKLAELKRRKEIELAQAIQRNVLIPPIHNRDIRIHGVYLPSENLSGDMYAWYQIHEFLYGIILIDIMGHGTSSSLISMSLGSLLAGIIKRVSEPVHVYEELNKHFYSLFRNQNNAKLYFCTGIYLLVDVKEKTIRYFNAGHPAGVLIGGCENRLLKSATVPIGMKPDPVISCETLTYSENDIIVLYTDGLCDSLKLKPSACEQFIVNNGKTTFGWLNEERLRSLLTDRFHTKQVDDIAVVTIQFPS